MGRFAAVEAVDSESRTVLSVEVVNDGSSGVLNQAVSLWKSLSL